MQGTMDGWLSTKKPGRDDAAIQRDQKKALAARKKRRSAAQRRPKKKQKSQTILSDEDSIDDFVVDDDEIEEDEWDSNQEESSAEEEEDGSLDDSDDNDNGNSFLPTFRKRTSRPSDVFQRKKQPRNGSKPNKRQRGTQNHRSTGTSKRTRAPSLKSTWKTTSVIDICDDSDDDSLEKPTVSNSDNDNLTSPDLIAPSKAAKKNTRPFVQSLDSSDSDDESITAVSKPQAKTLSVDDWIEGSKTIKKAGTKTESKYFASSARPAVKSKRALQTKLTLSDDDSDDSVPQASKLGRKSDRKPLDSEDDDDDLFAKKPPARKPAKRTKSPFDDSSSEDDDKAPVARKNRLKKKKKLPNQEASDYAIARALAGEESEEEDPDEQAAVQAALKQSLKEQARTDAVVVNEHTGETIVLEESEEEDDEEAEAEQAATTASSVLETANTLSAHLIRVMTGWSSTGQQDVAQGLIVDGAMAMFQTASSRATTTDPAWISSEELKRACPQVTLKNYQEIGVNWLALLHGLKFGNVANVNGILADEMGLGKTVQTIVFLAWLKYRNQSQSNDSDSLPHLIVVPVSVLSNWEREFEQFCPDMNVVKYHGSLAERQAIQDDLRQYLPSQSSKSHDLDVILAPVTIFQKERSDDRSFLGKFSYDYLVVDEAHALKNPRGIRYRKLNQLRTQHRLLLTGTPVQNSPKELMSLLCFLMPLFGQRFSGDTNNDEDAHVGESMLRHFVEMENSSSGSVPKTNETAYRKLKQLFAPFVLRRKKEDVLKLILPPKERKVEYVNLDDAGRAAYNSILQAHVVRRNKKIPAGQGEHVFTCLRKAATHPLLLRTRYTSPEEIDHLATCFFEYGAFQGDACTKDKVKKELEGYSDFQIHIDALHLVEENELRRERLGRYILDEEDMFCSPKFVRLRQLLPELISNGHRVLIFSIWTRCLDLLACLMEHLDIEYLRMEGSTPAGERQTLIDTFNRDTSIPVFLLSTKACGLGINLTAADTCIIHDLDFNPFNDFQAEDRCHRIGQQKNVTVIKMVTRDTVDEDIYKMQQRKSDMNAAIMDKKALEKNKKEVLDDAVNRFLQSPEVKPQTSKTASTNAEKENAAKNAVAIDDGPDKLLV